MTILYQISNVIIPIGLLTYLTLQKIKNKQQLGYGQWFCMILILFLMNFISLFITMRHIILFIDLIAKLGIALMPKKINDIIEKQISYLHLQIFVQMGRSWFINNFYLIYMRITEYALSKMDQLERKQFKNALIDRLNVGDNTKTQNKLNLHYKHYQSIGVGCDIQIQVPLNEEIQKYRKSLEKQKETEKIKATEVSNNHHPSKNLNKSSKQIVNQSKQSNYDKNNYNAFASNKTRFNHHTPTKKTQHPFLKRSTTDIFDEENIENDNNLFSKQIENMSYRRYQPATKLTDNKIVSQIVKDKSQQPSLQKIVNKRLEQNKKIIENTKNPVPQHMLNQLDISVSQYSQMFDNEQQFNDIVNRLLCKVQSIVQIGSKGNHQLEIYNLQLYTEDQLRIVSLYGRQFQRHKLVQMEQLTNGYYNLYFGNSKIDKRRVKFRGNHQAFKKYLVKN